MQQAWRLPHDIQSVGAARRMVVDLVGPERDDAVQVTSELVANAVEQALIDSMGVALYASTIPMADGLLKAFAEPGAHRGLEVDRRRRIAMPPPRLGGQAEGLGLEGVERLRQRDLRRC